MKRLIILFCFISGVSYSQLPNTSGYLITNSNGSVSIGTRVNTASLTVTNFETSFPTPQLGTIIHVVSDAVTNGRISSDTYNNSSVAGPNYQGRRGRGTAASPLPPNADDVLVAIGADGYGVDSFTNISIGSMNIRADATFTNISKPTYISFTTTPTGSIVQAERLRILHTGQVKLNSYGSGSFTGTATKALQVDASGNIIEGNLGGSAAWGSITGTLSDQSDLQTALNGKEASIAAGTNAQYWRGDKSWQTLDKSAVGLPNVDNESKATMFTNPTFTGTVGIPNSQITNAMLAGSIATSKITGYAGYSINVQALTSSPGDGATVYFGMLPKAPVSAAATSKIYIRQAGTITAAEIYCYSGTAGTNEAWSLYIRVNNTTDNLIATLSVSTNERVFTNSSLSIAVNAGDYIEIKGVQPTWVTNPLTTIYGGYIRIN